MMINISKKCSKCGDNKEITEFSKDKYSKDGFNSKCKLCNKTYYLENKQSFTIRNQKQYKENKEKWLEDSKQWYLKNKDLGHKEKRKQYSINNKEKLNITKKKWRDKNPHFQSWRNLIIVTLNKLGKSKESSTQELLGYSALDLKNHLDSLGMKWHEQNIDHKIPITWFKSETPSYIVNDLRNLHPLDFDLNISKGNLYMHPVASDYLELTKEWILEKYQNSLVT